MSDHMKIDWTKTDMRARITELEAQLAELATENERLKQAKERWQQNMREAYGAFSAMRNDLNELFPMQSTEADLLTGPEWSVSCAAIVEAANEAHSRTGVVKALPRPDEVFMTGGSICLEYADYELRDEAYDWLEQHASHPRDTNAEQPAPECRQPAAGAVRVCPVRDAICPHGIGCLYNDGMDCDMEASRADLAYQKHAALYTIPSEQAVTEAIAKIEQTFPARTWGLLPRFFSDKEWGGLIFAEGSQDIMKATIAAGDTPAGALNAALKAAKEARG